LANFLGIGKNFTNGPLGQSSGVAAQYWLSEQQYQLASGQHPAGHSVSSGPQLVLAIFFLRIFLRILGPFGQSSGVAAQYWLSEQQYQLASGQHPAGHSVSSGPQLVLANFLVIFIGPFGQSSGVAAQYWLSEQQYQLASGQQPAGHSVSSGPQLALATFFFNRFLRIMGPLGQSSGVAAQYWLSEQQYQLASGQQPAGHSVSSGPQLVLANLIRLSPRVLGDAAATAKKLMQ